jgi:CBS domain-containing protein
MGLLKLANETAEIGPDALVTDAVRLMFDRKVGALAVTEMRRCVGIFTERDLLRRVVHAGKDPATTRVKEVMTSPVVSVSDHTSIAEAAGIMRENNFRHLAIVDRRGQLEGIVALRYLLYELMDELEKKVGDLAGYLMADGPGG